MKPSDFAKNHKINKALGKSDIMIGEGDRLAMGPCIYKVVSPAGAEQTMLEDERGLRFAIPSNKVKFLIKKGMARKYFKEDYGIYKAKGAGMPSQPSGMGGGKPRGLPVGTMKQDHNGNWRKKISDNPPTWVHMSDGTAHPHHEGDSSHHTLLHDESRRQAVRVHMKIMRHAHPDDHEGLKQKFKKYVDELSAFKNLVKAHNTQEVDDKGKKLPRAAIPKSLQDSVYARQEKAEKHLKEFVDAFKASIKRRKGK